MYLLSYSCTQSLMHSVTHALSYSLSHSVTHLVTHSATQSLTHCVCAGNPWQRSHTVALDLSPHMRCEYGEELTPANNGWVTASLLCRSSVCHTVCCCLCLSHCLLLPLSVTLSVAASICHIVCRCLYLSHLMAPAGISWVRACHIHQWVVNK